MKHWREWDRIISREAWNYHAEIVMLRTPAAKLSLLCMFVGSLFLACAKTTAPREDLSIKPSLPVGRIIAGRDMTTARGGHAATVLPDFTVLITGGKDEHGKVLASTEIYSPSTELFSPAAKMLVAREGHIAALLPDGKTLIAGGMTSGGVPLASCEDYDFEGESFTRRGSMHSPRVHAAAVMLRDGRLLITGGENGSQVLASGELYDVLTGKWTLVVTMTEARANHSATMLSDGRVLIAGGTGSHHTALDTAEIFDPKNNQFTAAGHLHDARSSHTTALLANGDVLIAGGTTVATTSAGNTALASAEIYNAATASFTPTGSLTEARSRLPQSAALLDGRVVIMGGAASSEIFIPRTGLFRTVDGNLDTARYDSAALQVMDGTTRFFGGYDSKGVSTAKTWIYRLK
jgi:hypothetical protein